MVKNKNLSYFRWAFTISPQTGSISPSRLEELTAEFLSKRSKSIEKYAYSMEMGKTNNHPHVHVLVSFKKNKRRDVLLTTLYSYFCKKLPHLKTPRLVYVSAAHNPVYYLKDYMTKEGGKLINEGYDVGKLFEEAEALSEKQKIYKLGQFLKPVTRRAFPYIYRMLLSTDALSPIMTIAVEMPFEETRRVCCTNNHIKLLFDALTSCGFDYSFCVWNIKQVKTIMEYESGLIPLCLKYDD